MKLLTPDELCRQTCGHTGVLEWKCVLTVLEVLEWKCSIEKHAQVGGERNRFAHAESERGGVRKRGEERGEDFRDIIPCSAMGLHCLQ